MRKFIFVVIMTVCSQTSLKALSNLPETIRLDREALIQLITSPNISTSPLNSKETHPKLGIPTPNLNNLPVGIVVPENPEAKQPLPIRRTITTKNYQACQKDTESNLWCRLRMGYKLQIEENTAIQDAIDRFAESQGFFNKVCQRATPFLYYVVREIEQRNLPTELALLPFIESAYYTAALSPKAAAGVWQFIPSTGTQFGLTQDEWYDARYDIVASTRAALSYLQRLHRKFQNDWFLALAAYNWGEGNISKAIEKNRGAGKPTDFWSLDMPTETRQYVPNLIAIAEIIANPQDYGINLRFIANSPYFKQIEIDHPISLEIAADLAGLSVDDFKRFNPTYLQEMTAPTGSHRFTLPIENANKFKQQIAERSAMDLVPAPVVAENAIPVGINLIGEMNAISQFFEINNRNEKVSVTDVFQLTPDHPVEIPIYHRVKKGETLWHIAKRYNTTLSKLRELNGSDGRFIKAGQQVKVGGALPEKPKELKVFLVAAPVFSGKTQPHQVQKKENLWRVAKRYKTTVPLLRAVNDFDGQSLNVGDKLEIPLPEEATPIGEDTLLAEKTAGNTFEDQMKQLLGVSKSVPNTTETREEPLKKKVIHTVKAGESLWLIARYYQVSIDELAQWNSLKAQDSLQSGQKLTIWRDG